MSAFLSRLRAGTRSEGIAQPVGFDWMVVLALMVVCGLYVGLQLRTGWVPSDEGTLAQSALRIYGGQLPHRDFAEIYTGGLSLWHAVAFRVLGVRLLSLRIAVFVCFMAWLPAVYFVARRFVSPAVAAVATLTAVVWSYPNYVAAMPSWYNLFFATFGAAALLRYLEVRTRRWLFLAGVCGGCSVLVKVVGLYYVAAVLLLLLFVEQSRRVEGEGRRPAWIYRIVCGLMLAGYLAALTVMVWPQLHDGEAYHFLLPSVTCVGILVMRERRVPVGASSGRRFVALLGLAGPFFAGLVVMLGAFSIPYAVSRSAGALWHGVFGSTAARMTGLGGKMHAPGLAYVIYGLVPFALIVSGMYAAWTRKKVALGIVGAVLAAVLACSAFPHDLQDTWLMAGMLTPLVVLLGAVMIYRAVEEGIDARGQERMMLMVCLAAVCSLVQYPFPWVTYFCYTAPLTLLAAVACVSAKRNPTGRVMLGVVMAFFLGMGIFGMVAKHVYDPGLELSALQPLRVERAGGLRVEVRHPGYEELIPFLQAHSPNGWMYAGNDCPELYFLSGLKNPTRDDTGAPTADVLAALKAGTLRLVVFNDASQFASSAVVPELRAAVMVKLPNSSKIGRFSIYWG